MRPRGGIPLSRNSFALFADAFAEIDSGLEVCCWFGGAVAIAGCGLRGLRLDCERESRGSNCVVV